MYILGIDQGIANMGYSIMDNDKLIVYGCINTNSKSSIEQRFYIIYSELVKIIEKYKPEVICCEKLFYTSPKKGTRNKSASIIYTNMITGILACLAGTYDIELRMFVPSKVKKAICNNGIAKKEEVISEIKSRYEIITDKTKYEHVCDSVAIAYTCNKENIENPEVRQAFEKSKFDRLEKIRIEEEKRLAKIEKEKLKEIKAREREEKRKERERIKAEKEARKAEKAKLKEQQINGKKN